MKQLALKGFPAKPKLRIETINDKANTILYAIKIKLPKLYEYMKNPEK